MSDKLKTFAVIPYENSLNVKNITGEEFLVKYKLWLKDKNLFNDDMEYDLEHIRKNGEKALRIGNFVYATINDKSEKAYLILLSFLSPLLFYHKTQKKPSFLLDFFDRLKSRHLTGSFYTSI